MLDRSGDSCLPVLGVGSEEFLAAVSIGEFKDSTESDLLSYHSFVTCWSDDLVSPPARGNLDCKDVLGAGS